MSRERRDHDMNANAKLEYAKAPDTIKYPPHDNRARTLPELNRVNTWLGGPPISPLRKKRNLSDRSDRSASSSSAEEKTLVEKR